MTQTQNVFNPVDYSIEENEYLLDHIGEPPVVAATDSRAGVNPRAVGPVLERVYELIELQKHRGKEWTGIDTVKAGISAYLDHAKRWREDRRRGAPRFPTMFSFDGKNRPHRYGPGSDAGKVTTYFDTTGQRHTIAVELLPDGATEWTPDWVTSDSAPTSKDGVIDDADKNRIECTICGHTETFKAESRASYNAARARISKHLRTAKTETERHREVHTLEFGASNG